MKSLDVLFENKNRFLGKNFTAIGIVKDQNVPVQEHVSVTIAEDVKVTVDEKKYRVNQVVVPAWMDANFFICEFPKIRLLKYLAIEGAKMTYKDFLAIPERLMKYLLSTEPMEQLAILKLWRKGMEGSLRSGFRKNIFMHLKLWVEDKKPSYATPFSPRQLECVLDPFICTEATHLADSIKNVREDY
jgi:hypothetical protein